MPDCFGIRFIRDQQQPLAAIRDVVQVPCSHHWRILARRSGHDRETSAPGGGRRLEAKAELAKACRVRPPDRAVGHRLLEMLSIHTIAIVGDREPDLSTEVELDADVHGGGICGDGIVDEVGNGRFEAVAHVPQARHGAGGIGDERDCLLWHLADSLF